jgi:hypothetical protein
LEKLKKRRISSTSPSNLFFFHFSFDKRRHTFDVAMKGILQTWWSQYKATEGEAIKTKLQVQNINIVADGFSILLSLFLYFDFIFLFLFIFLFIEL